MKKASRATTSTISSKAIALLVLIPVCVLGFFVLPSHAIGEGNSGTRAQVSNTVTAQQTRAEFEKAVRYQHMAGVWSARRGVYNVYAHRQLHPSRSLEYETSRAKSWHSAMLQEKRTTEQYLKQVATGINSCVAQGAPRYVCLALREGAVAEGVPLSWAHDPDLLWVIRYESRFRPTAGNPTSSAYGLFQFLPSTWAGVHCKATSDPKVQSICGYRYIRGRYHTPGAARRFEEANGWY